MQIFISNQFQHSSLAHSNIEINYYCHFHTGGNSLNGPALKTSRNVGVLVCFHIIITMVTTPQLNTPFYGIGTFPVSIITVTCIGLFSALPLWAVSISSKTWGAERLFL